MRSGAHLGRAAGAGTSGALWRGPVLIAGDAADLTGDPPHPRCVMNRPLLSAAAAIALSLAVAAATAPLRAQSAEPPQAPPPPDTAARIPATVPRLRTQALRIIGTSLVVADARAIDNNGPFDRGLAVEYERRLSRRTSLALSASYWDVPERVAAGRARQDEGGAVEYWTTELQLRLYPGGRALNGIWVGVAGGVANASGGLWDDPFMPPGNTTGAVAGAEVGYSRLLGPRKNLTLDLGLGFRRLFIHRNDNAVRDYPTIRIGFGIAF